MNSYSTSYTVAQAFAWKCHYPVHI